MPNMKRGSQQDSHAFFLNLMEDISKWLIDFTLTSGENSWQTTCRDCGTTKEESNSFWEIAVPVMSSLEEALSSHFGSEAMSGDDNKVWCDTCLRQTPVIRRHVLKKSPDIFLISLNRFNYDPLLKETYRVEDASTIPMELDLSAYRTPGSQPQPQDRMRCVGMVLHYGASSQSGHYMAVAINSLGQWYLFDDAAVMPLLTSEVLRRNDVYYVLYERVSKRFPTPTPLDILAPSEANTTDVVRFEEPSFSDPDYSPERSRQSPKRACIEAPPGDLARAGPIISFTPSEQRRASVFELSSSIIESGRPFSVVNTLEESLAPTSGFTRTRKISEIPETTSGPRRSSSISRRGWPVARMSPISLEVPPPGSLCSVDSHTTTPSCTSPSRRRVSLSNLVVPPETEAIEQEGGPISPYSPCSLKTSRSAKRRHDSSYGLCASDSDDEEASQPLAQSRHNPRPPAPASPEWTCALCGALRPEGVSRVRHEMLHSLRKLPDDGPHRCGLCTSRFATIQAVHRHTKRHVEARKARHHMGRRVRDIDFQTENGLVKHSPVSKESHKHKAHTCNTCSLVFKDCRSLQRHRKVWNDFNCQIDFKECIRCQKKRKQIQEDNDLKLRIEPWLRRKKMLLGSLYFW